jgi:16S rRNA A1518/A1519 N6-dimethyltransferase RsmA/KsgA/DIM1 with predicted DNA glycosylase/AP lyase activity
LKLDAARVEDTLVQAGIDPSMRPGTLAVKDFIRLARALGPALRSSSSSDA